MDGLDADGAGRSSDDLARIVAAHTPALHDYCLSLLGQPAEAADAVRDALRIARRAEPDSRMTDDAVRPWLFALARNEVVRRRPSGPWKPPVHAPEFPVDPEAQQREGRVRMAASRLTPFHRELLDLSLRHQLSEPEIGYVLDVNSASVKSQLAEATGALVAAFAAVAWPDDPDPSAEVGPVARYAALPLVSFDVDPAGGSEHGNPGDAEETHVAIVPPLPRSAEPEFAASPAHFTGPEYAADDVGRSGTIGPRLPSGGRRNRWAVAATVVLVLFAVAGVVAVPNLFTAHPGLTLPALINPTAEDGATASGTQEQSPGSGLGLAPTTPSANPSASVSGQVTPSRSVGIERPRPPRQPPVAPRPGYTVTSSLADTTQGCPSGWTAIIYVTVAVHNGATPPSMVRARWWFVDGSWAEQIAANDGGGHYHVVIGGLPYNQQIGYSGRATHPEGTDTYSSPSYVSRKSNCTD